MGESLAELPQTFGAQDEHPGVGWLGLQLKLAMSPLSSAGLIICAQREGCVVHVVCPLGEGAGCAKCNNFIVKSTEGVLSG